MGKKSRRKSKTRKVKPSEKSNTRTGSWRLAALLIIGAGAIYALVRSARPVADSVATIRPQQESQRPYYENPDEARPFPATLEPSRFGIEFVSRAYEIARQIPEVLVQQPCDCNCGVLGHRSLLDCYASNHAASCSACLQEAVFAHGMTAAGRTPVEIREDIDLGLWRTVDLGALMP